MDLKARERKKINESNFAESITAGRTAEEVAMNWVKVGKQSRYTSKLEGGKATMG
jgi:hypothetical protein